MVYKSNAASGIFYRINDGTGNFLTQTLVDANFNYTFVGGGGLNNDQKGDIIWVAAGTNNKKYIGYTRNAPTPTALNNLQNQSNSIQIFPNQQKILFT